MRQFFTWNEIEWEGTWTHKLFRFYEYLFGRRFGIRAETSAVSFLAEDGRRHVSYSFHSWESLIVHFETLIRSFSFQFFNRISSVRVFIPMIQTTAGFPTPASPFLFAIAFDSSGTTTSFTASTNPTLTMTCTGSNRLLFSGLNITIAVDDVTAWTYAGAALTKITSQVWASSTQITQLAYIVAPSTVSTSTLSVTLSIGLSGDLTAASYSGAKQTSVPDAQNTGNSDVPVSTATISVTTTATPNCWTHFMLGSLDTNLAASTGSTQRTSSGKMTAMFDSNGTVAASSSITMNAAWAGDTTRWGGIIVSFAPAVVATTRNDLTLLGVGT